MITKRPWFGPKTYGWGWKPVAWQGWATLGLFVLVIIGSGFLLPAGWIKVAVHIGSLVALVVIVALTGSKPGGGWGSRDAS